VEELGIFLSSVEPMLAKKWLKLLAISWGLSLSLPFIVILGSLIAFLSFCL